MDVHASDDPAAALTATRAFLESRPVEHNLVLTLLEQRTHFLAPGRYWWAVDGDAVTAVLFQSPPTFHATVTPAGPGAIDALVEALAAEGRSLPGISAEAATAARFAGRWTERRKVAGRVADGQRLYRMDDYERPPPVAGGMRVATAPDRDLLVGWWRRFAVAVGSPTEGIEEAADARLATGRVWVWDDGGPSCTALASPIAAGVSRVGLVYTPDDRRRRGYAAALVGAISELILKGENATPILYTQLSNPTSNAVYQRLGYYAVEEVLRYRFDE